jgi:hypothetical protein
MLAMVDAPALTRQDYEALGPRFHPPPPAGIRCAVSEPDRIRDPWGARTPFAPGERWPERVDVCLDGDTHEDDVERWVQTASTLHSNGDGIDIAVRDGGIAGVRGRAIDRVIRGRLDPMDA